MTPEKVFAMKMAKIFPALIAKAERKGRTAAEVMEVTSWMTGYTHAQIGAAYAIDSEVSYGDFFRHMPAPNPNRVYITGTICGIRVETIEDPLMQEIRRLDKLVDELAKGKSMEKILRKAPTESQTKRAIEPICFSAIIEPVPEKGGAYVRVPCDIKSRYGKGRMKVHALFDGVPYDGSVVNMGVRHTDGSVCYIIGVRKDIQKEIGKAAGDTIEVQLTPIV